MIGEHDQAAGSLTVSLAVCRPRSRDAGDGAISLARGSSSDETGMRQQETGRVGR